jgi:hypothetical protein
LFSGFGGGGNRHWQVQFVGSRFRHWMREAGFSHVYVEPLGDVHIAVIGTKSG